MNKRGFTWHMKASASTLSYRKICQTFAFTVLLIVRAKKSQLSFGSKKNSRAFRANIDVILLTLLSSSVSPIYKYPVRLECEWIHRANLVVCRVNAMRCEIRAQDHYKFDVNHPMLCTIQPIMHHANHNQTRDLDTHENFDYHYACNHFPRSIGCLHSDCFQRLLIQVQFYIEEREGEMDKWKYFVISSRDREHAFEMHLISYSYSSE